MGWDKEQVALLQEALKQNEPTGRWRQVLEVLLPTGVASRVQLEAATGLTRDQLKGLLGKLEQVGAGGARLVYRVQEKVPWPGQRGRAPTVYGLGEAGAALLRAEGHKEARACRLDSGVAIGHALATLDVYLAARRAGLEVVVEREVANEQGQRVRPDNLVTLEGGVRALFETEQVARAAQLRRIVESIQKKVAFFGGLGEGKISRVVRMLFALPAGRELERTWQMWERALAVVVQEMGGELPFRVVGMALQEFLARPDWGEPPDGGRWRELWGPQSLAAQGEGAGGATAGEGQPARVPEALVRYTSTQSRLVLNAMWEVFRERAGEKCEEERPDTGFFELINMIYLASHGEGRTVWEQAALPQKSLRFLRYYLGLQPRLREALNRELERGQRMSWNPSTIRHAMQRVVDVFLAYHGYCSDGPLLACADGAEWSERTTRQFFVRVVIREPELVGGEGGVAGREEVELAERALEWVLWALFAYSEQVGLKRPPYW